MGKTNGFILPESDDPAVDNAFMGDQVNGFGYLHDGSVDTVFRFISIVFFQHAESGPFPNPGGFAVGEAGDITRRQVEDYVFAFDSNFAPVVGQQITLNAKNVSVVESRLALLLQRAELKECDLVAKEHKANREYGYLYKGEGLFKTDSSKRPVITEQDLRGRANKGSYITYTCVPPMSGERIALDRDEDGVLNGDEQSVYKFFDEKHEQAAKGFFQKLNAWLKS